MIRRATGILIAACYMIIRIEMIVTAPPDVSTIEDIALCSDMRHYVIVRYAAAPDSVPECIWP